jgi:hypothetical protein
MGEAEHYVYDPSPRIPRNIYACYAHRCRLIPGIVAQLGRGNNEFGNNEFETRRPKHDALDMPTHV